MAADPDAAAIAARHAVLKAMRGSYHAESLADAAVNAARPVIVAEARAAERQHLGELAADSINVRRAMRVAGFPVNSLQEAAVTVAIRRVLADLLDGDGDA